MKHLYLFILSIVVFGTQNIYAQVVITNSSFPQVGDVIKQAIDVAPSIDVGTAGVNKTWDFTSLSSTQAIETVFLDATTAPNIDQFPNATMFVNVEGNEYYLKQEANAIKQLGFVGSVSDINVVARFSPQGNYRTAPISYNDTYSSSTGFSVTRPAEDIPALSSLNLPVTPDSVRISRTSTTAYKADAYGILKAPSGTFDVLRIEEIQTNNSKIEVYIAVAGIVGTWVELTPATTPGLENLEALTTFLDDTPILAYQFLATDEKAPLARVVMDTAENAPAQVVFKPSARTPIAEIGGNQPIFNAFPNPAYKDVRIDIRGFKTGDYDFKIYNLTGKVVMHQAIDLKKDTALNFNISSLPRGTYLYALLNKDGKIVKTNRLVIVKP